MRTGFKKGNREISENIPKHHETSKNHGFQIKLGKNKMWFSWFGPFGLSHELRCNKFRPIDFTVFRCPRFMYYSCNILCLLTSSCLLWRTHLYNISHQYDNNALGQVTPIIFIYIYIFHTITLVSPNRLPDFIQYRCIEWEAIGFGSPMVT